MLFLFFVSRNNFFSFCPHTFSVAASTSSLSFSFSLPSSSWFNIIKCFFHWFKISSWYWIRFLSLPLFVLKYNPFFSSSTHWYKSASLYLFPDKNLLAYIYFLYWIEFLLLMSFFFFYKLNYKLLLISQHSSVDSLVILCTILSFDLSTAHTSPQTNPFFSFSLIHSYHMPRYFSNSFSFR